MTSSLSSPSSPLFTTNNSSSLSGVASSLEWKTWAACSIQTAWRHSRGKKLHESLVQAEHNADSWNIVSSQQSLSSQQRPQKPVDPYCFVATTSTSDGRSTDIVLEELKSLKLGMEAIREALDRICGNENLRIYTEERLYEEIEKVQGMDDEMQMKVYQALSCQATSTLVESQIRDVVNIFISYIESVLV